MPKKHKCAKMSVFLGVLLIEFGLIFSICWHSRSSKIGMTYKGGILLRIILDMRLRGFFIISKVDLGV